MAKFILIDQSKSLSLVLGPFSGMFPLEKLGNRMSDQAKDETQTRRKQSREERRRQLIEATIRVIAAQGYAAITLADVARMAGHSYGMVNFHFSSKDNLLAETLDYLSEEYRNNWQSALAAAPPDPASQIAALLQADFNPAIVTPERLSAWVSFWGESQNRPLYQAHCGANDAAYIATFESLCDRMNKDHGYGQDPVKVARALRVLTEGLWLELMTRIGDIELTAALETVWTSAAALYPRHFGPQGLLPAKA